MTTALDVQGRRTILYVTNKSGGAVALGDVVVGDDTNDESFTTTTSAGLISSWVGVVIEANGIANNVAGRVAVQGYVSVVNLSASTTRGHFIKTHTVAKQAVDAGASRVTGVFGKVLTTSATPPAILFGMPDGSTGAAGSPATPALTLGTTNSVGAASTLVATDATIALFDATAPVDISTAAAVGSAAFAARRDHVHRKGYHGCKATNSGAQNLTNGAYVILNFDTTSYDTDNFHHTSAANLTGTVAKSGTTALVGTGTSFTTELAVGQVISVPGGATEKRVVSVITDNTHLTVSTAFAQTASGQTATRVNSALVAMVAGYYRVSFVGAQTFSPGVGSWWGISLNGSSAGNGLVAIGPVPNDSVEAEGTVETTLSLAQYDMVEIHARTGATSKQALQTTYGPFFMLDYLGT